MNGSLSEVTAFGYLSLFCLFVWGLSSHLKKNSLIWRRHHYRWRATIFDLCSALMAFERWGFFSVQNLLWHGGSIYNGHLRGAGTLTPIAERKAVELSQPVFYDLGLSRLEFEHPTFRLQGQRSYPLPNVKYCASLRNCANNKRMGRPFNVEVAKSFKTLMQWNSLFRAIRLKGRRSESRFKCLG